MKKLEACIGHTPMVELVRLRKPDCGRIFAKLEGNNPAGSVKDRAALGMLNGAEARGELKKGVRIIEPTSGNTGIALAMLASRRGYDLTLVMPESMTVERRSTMSAYGAKIELTSSDAGMEGSIDRAREMVAQGEGIMLDQFANDDNWRAHKTTTGPEIWKASRGKITHFVSAMGTTGTIMGVSRALKKKRKKIKIIGVHPDEHSSIAGIRRWPEEYLPKIFDRRRVDEIMDVSESEARTMTRRLAEEEGIFTGVSAGGAVHIAVKVAATLSKKGWVGVILPDRGDRYLSTDLFR
ncbi:cysteine synthase CysM [Magnetococcales bacterium HHB-1]